MLHRWIWFTICICLEVWWFWYVLFEFCLLLKYNINIYNFLELVIQWFLFINLNFSINRYFVLRNWFILFLKFKTARKIFEKKKKYKFIIFTNRNFFKFIKYLYNRNNFFSLLIMFLIFIYNFKLFWIDSNKHFIILHA